MPPLKKNVAQSASRKSAPVGAGLVFVAAGLMAFLGVWESGKTRILVVYADKLAGGLPTVCNGLTWRITTTPIIVGEVWTDEKCIAEEEKAVLKVQKTLLNCFQHNPSQNVFNAATSHAWNNGVYATCSSGAMQAWNREEWYLGCKRLAYSDSGRRIWAYVKDGKNADGSWKYKFVQGLANRRDAEFKMCVDWVEK